MLYRLTFVVKNYTSCFIYCKIILIAKFKIHFEKVCNPHVNNKYLQMYVWHEYQTSTSAMITSIKQVPGHDYEYQTSTLAMITSIKQVPQQWLRV